MGYVFGEVDATLKPDTAFPPARERLLLHDHAGTGFPSWEPLINGGAATGVVSFNGKGLEIVSPDVSTNTPNGQAFGASALMRMVRPAAQQKLYLIFDWTLRVFRSNNGVFTYTKGVEFGVDTADFGTAGTGAGGIGGVAPVAGNRTLCMARCLMYDEPNATYFGGKWQLTNGSAGAPGEFDLLDLGGNLIAPSVAGYEALAVGMNYGKSLRQRTEMVIDLTPQALAESQVALSVTSGSASATYTGGQVPIVGSGILGTSVAPGTFVAAVNTGTSTVTLSQNATATTSTTAGASFSGATVTARVTGLRHNGVGFGTLAGTSGYNDQIGSNAHANELIAQQATVSAAGITAPALSRDVGFLGGLNIYAQIDNRSTQASKSKLTLNRVRVGAF